MPCPPLCACRDSAGEHHHHLPSDLVHAAVSGLKSECRSSDLNRNSLADSFATPPALMAQRGANTHTHAHTHTHGPMHAPLHHHQMSRLGALTADPSRSGSPAHGRPASANGSVAATATATATCTAANSTSASGTTTPVPGGSMHGGSAAAHQSPSSASCNGYAAPGSRGSSGGRGPPSPFAPAAQLPPAPDGATGTSSCTDGSAPEPCSQDIVRQGAAVDPHLAAGHFPAPAPTSTPYGSQPHTRPGSHQPSYHHSRNPSHGSGVPGALPGSNLACPTGGHHAAGAAGACETAAAAAARTAAADPMSLVNGMVHRSNTMPGSGLEAAMAVEGASPAATEEEHVQALLTK